MRRREATRHDPGATTQGEPAAVDDDSLLRRIAAAPAVPLESAAHRRLMPGVIIDESFRIERVLGAGAMGVVYEATDLSLGRRVALKLHAADVDEVRASRMWREARALARLAHPNVITVHEVGLHEQRVYIAMELVAGGTAREFLRRAPPGRVHPWRDVLRIYEQAAAGLAAAHAVGLVHRDFKPENVLIGEDGRVRVADFGLAVATGAAPEPGTQRAPIGADAHDPRLTRTGATVGTPAYMAPEQVVGLAVDHRADQFSFFVSLYEGVYGVRPFVGIASGESISAAVAAGLRAPGVHARVPKWLHAIMLRGLALDPHARFGSMEEVVAILRAEPTRRTKRRLLGLGLVAALGGAVLATRATPVASPPCEGVGDEIAEVWNDDILGEVDTALHRTGSPLATAAAAHIRSVLDEYARRWHDQRIEACTATRVLGTQSEAMLDRRMVCVDARRRDLEAVVGVMRAADADTVERADEVLGALGSIDACADALVLGAGAAPPDDPERRSLAEQLQGEAARVSAQTRAGRAKETRPLAEDVLQRASALGHAPTIVHARLALAELLDDLVERDAALAAYVEAHRDATRASDARSAWRSALAIARITGRVTTGTQEALRWLETADGWAARMDASATDRVSAHLARADVLLQASRLVDAAASVEAARAELDGVADVEAVRGQVLASLGLVRHRLGEYDSAHAAIAEALRVLEASLGDGHPRLAGPLATLGHIEKSRGRPLDALNAAERVVVIMRERRGERSLAYAVALRERADAFEGAARFEEAIDDYQDALARLEALDSAAPAEVVLTLNNLGNLFANLGRTDEALSFRRRALDLAIPTYGTGSVQVASIRLNLAGVLASQERHEAAVQELRAAWPVLERQLGPDHVSRVGPGLNLATSLAMLERFEEAHAALREVDEILAANPEAAAGWGSGLAMTRGAVLEQEGRIAEATAAFGRAVKLLEASGDPGSAESVRARMRWADLETLDGDASSAAEALRRAVADAERLDMAPVTLGRARFLLAKALWAAGREHADEARTQASAAVAILSPSEPAEAAVAARWLARKGG